MHLPLVERDAVSLLQIKLDNGSESNGRCPHFLCRLVAFADAIGLPIQLSTTRLPTANTIQSSTARGILEQHWNGTQLVDVETMLEWAKSMTGRASIPIVERSHKVYAKGITLTKGAMEEIEARLERGPTLPKWHILIWPMGG